MTAPEVRVVLHNMYCQIIGRKTQQEGCDEPYRDNSQLENSAWQIHREADELDLDVISFICVFYINFKSSRM